MRLEELNGKVALVTGASSGLGAGFASTLARAGAQVVLAARRVKKLEATAEAILREGGRATTLALDICNKAAIDEALTQLPALDILVNNAGIARSAAALDVSEEDWDAVINTNLKGMFFTAQAAARQMRVYGREGSIINIASILGVRQAGSVLPYAVSKSGTIQMTKSLALEVARFGIRVNAIAPGYISTELNQEFFESDAGKAMLRRIPQRRLGEQPDLDGALLLLASDASRYMTGSVLVVDGGHLLSSL
ncbi:2-deoxy-D-gluconate 3-dehydrogenase [Novosphingobium malaysiense]|uniref:2-deoxy-D-gluconate 3-dehydrogenase n=1 Tax=Novosphingobium malaysiense TaxID=1348853 RepID=A0A0B1ZH77_9SPHN|nr:2-deoxy-D-gluconate 3-dehydrogenase [Novosphingobium malaysiense]